MDATSPTGPPAAIGSAAVPRGMRAEFRAVLLYALWAGLALGANALGIATLPASAGLILIAGILIHMLNGLRVTVIGLGFGTSSHKGLFWTLMAVAVLLFAYAAWLVFTK